MANKQRSQQTINPLLRKQRTRQHIIADQSVNHVEYFVLQTGFTATREIFDYGFDLSISTFDRNGSVEAGIIRCQLKATDDIFRFA